MKRQIYAFLKVASILILGLCTSCQTEDLFEPTRPDHPDIVDYMTVTMQSNKLLPQQVATRSSDPKTEAEKAVNHMHIMYFNSETGELLNPYTDQKTGKARFFPYVETDLNVIKIDKHAMMEANIMTATNGNTALSATLKVYVCVLANMENIIDGVDENGYPMLDGDIVDMNTLQDIMYEHPSKVSGGAAILSLPRTGMPMTGQKSLILDPDNMPNNITVELTALMARVDFSIKIDAPVYEEGLPKLTMQKWSVHNLPTEVSLNNDSNAVTVLSSDPLNPNKTTASVENNQIISNKAGTISFCFYMFENIQQQVSELPDNYPPGDYAGHQPKYKPLLANENATYVLLDALYTTYDDIEGRPSTYDVKYKVYIGANHTNDFKIKRNYQYKNDITIVGITNNDWADINGSIPETTFDARVNVSASNPYYISMLNERVLDAHFCVLPMDVYFFGTAGMQKIEVSVDKDWVGMEKIPADVMSADDISNNLQEAMGAFTAGHGKRKYFTVGLVDELRSEATSIDLTDSRDRIYFYIDENLDLEGREAIITLKYYEDDELIKTEQRIINQTHLLPVTVVRNNTTYRTVYMEAIEEYLDNYDPLDPFNSTQVYDGLPWGFDGESVANISFGDESYNNYVDGLVYTIHVMRDKIKDYTLNGINKDANAFLYCYNKNKRCNDEGAISWEFETNDNNWISQWNVYSYYDDGSEKDFERYPLWEGNHAKWFLPGITQMEKGLEQYFHQYEEFKDNLYWSSAVGKKRGSLGIGYTGSNNHGRATNIDATTGEHVNSEDGDKGYVSRSTSLRVRAFRWDLEPMAAD